MALLTFLACAPPPGTATGRLVDARTDAPVPDVAVTLATTHDRCPPVSAATDADGRFTATGLCGEVAYTATPTHPDWYMPIPEPVTPDVTLRAFHTPATPGVYVSTGATVTPLVTHTVVDVVHVFDSDTEVRFPVEIPGTLPRISGDTALLVVGGVLGDAPRFEPLVPSAEKRWFGTRDAPVPIDPWVYFGVRFASDTAFTPVLATLDPAHVERIAGPRPAAWYTADALPAGRYGLLTADATRAFLIDFGAAPPAP
jgi:hypothetical protein